MSLTLENDSGLDVSITTKVEHHNLEDSEAICFQEPCEEEVEPTNLEYNDDILYVEYASFSVGLMSMKVFMRVWIRISVLNMNHFLLTLQ